MIVYRNMHFLHIDLHYELREIDLLIHERKEDSTYLSGTTDASKQCTVLTKDVECQFNYLVPSLGMLVILSIILLY